MKSELILIAVSALLFGAQGVRGDESSRGRTTAGVAGIVGSGTSCRDYMLSYNSAQVQDSDATKSATIAAYLKANPSLHLGLNGPMNPNGADPHNQELSDRRVEAVRATLINAVDPSYKTRVGPFGDTNSRRERRVEVLFATTN